MRTASMRSSAMSGQACGWRASSAPADRLPGEPLGDRTPLRLARFAAEHRVAVREAAEARYHPVMAAGEREPVALAERGKDRQALPLVGDRLAMHQRQGEELPLGQS